ncbi:MAG: hypothetical protein ACYTJ0_19995 [Planctomycetota bacterium]
MIGVLRALPFGVRLGLSTLLLVMLGGFAASFTHLRDHHENRDERPGLTVDDLVGAYHGIRSEAPLLRALRADHPAELEGATPLAAAERQTLLDWLEGDRISGDYDNLDLGDMAPAEIIAVNCLGCHARDAEQGGEAAATLPLEYWDDVRSVAFSREINPTATEIVVTSMHTHALSLSALSIVLAGLLILTRWPRTLVSAAIALAGLGLLADLAGQWLTRSSPGLVWMIVAGGGVYGGVSCLSILAVLADAWLPRRAARA